MNPIATRQPPHNSMARRHLWQIGIAVLLAIAGPVIWWNLQAAKRQAVPASFPEGQQNTGAIHGIVQPIVWTTSRQWLEVTGNVQAELETPIASKGLGRVQNVLVREGDFVRRGQKLVVLEARDLDASLAQAGAGLHASSAGYENAEVAAKMEAGLSAARIAEARARIAQTEAALQAVTAKLELVQAGPRHQEREQAALAVSQAQSALTLAESNLKRMSSLYRDGAISAQQYDQFRFQYDVAKTQFDSAQQGRSITDEGSRAEEIRAAQQAVLQAQSSVQEARAGLKSAQAAALQTEVRKQEIKGAEAQVGLSRAGLELARVARSYAVLSAPFDGTITKRLADPGVMASPGAPLLKLQGGRLRLEVVVPESALASVRKGAAVPVHFDTLRKSVLTGRVAEIAPQGDAASHTFIVKLTLPTGSGVRSGMFGRAEFATGVEKRLSVPSTAVFEREGLHYLYTVDENRIARLRMVTVGEVVDSQVPILSGLNSGERVVTSGRERVADGSPIAEEAR